MSIECAIKYPCEIRKNLPDKEFVRLVMLTWLAKAIVPILRQQAPGAGAAELAAAEFSWYSVGTDGVKIDQADTLMSVYSRVAPIVELKHLCKDCEANFGNTDFGCTTQINFPISKKAELWLLESLPENADDPRLKSLIDFLTKLGADGKVFDDARKSGLVCELAVPATRTWGKGAAKFQISSSQILQLLFGTHELQMAQLSKLDTLLHLERNGPRYKKVTETDEGYLVEMQIQLQQQDKTITQLRWFMQGAADAMKGNWAMYVDG